MKPCDIVTMTSSTDTLNVTYTAYDNGGHLLNFRVDGYHGTGIAVPITSDSYASHSSPPTPGLA